MYLGPETLTEETVAATTWFDCGVEFGNREKL